jgi:hypothetical protein
MVVGSDSPTLPAGHLQKLLESGADVALGPCEDGGYYAIACRRVHERMFEGVEWSSPGALEQTARAARACGLSVDVGEAWWDVDEPASLARLASLDDLPPHTAGFLRRLGECGIK